MFIKDLFADRAAIACEPDLHFFRGDVSGRAHCVCGRVFHDGGGGEYVPSNHLAWSSNGQRWFAIPADQIEGEPPANSRYGPCGCRDCRPVAGRAPVNLNAFGQPYPVAHACEKPVDADRRVVEEAEAGAATILATEADPLVQAFDILRGVVNELPRDRRMGVVVAVETIAEKLRGIVAPVGEWLEGRAHAVPNAPARRCGCPSLLHAATGGCDGIVDDEGRCGKCWRPRPNVAHP